MKQIKIICKLITPLFMYGTSIKPEIRASSIKGLLRYWWRIFNKSKYKNKLLEKENKIFGSTNKASPVKIKVNNLQGVENCKSISDKNLEGLTYLFYFLRAERNKEYIVQGTKFEIIFTYQQEEQIKEYLDALYYLQLFGGMGSRSRRGAGNFVITNMTELDEVKLDYTRQLVLNLNVDSLEKIYVYEEFKNVLDVYKGNKKYEDWRSALSYIEKEYREKRDIYKADGYAPKSVFGLPIKGIKGGRMESPLIFKVVKLKDKYIPIIIKVQDNPLLKKEEYKKNGKNLVDVFLEDAAFFKKFYKIEKG